MSCWRVATEKEIWKNIEMQKCLICGEEGVLGENQEAWENFIEVYSPLMWDRVNKHISESNKEDVIQDIYVRLLKSNMSAIRKWCKNPSASFSAYLFKYDIQSAIRDDLRKKYFISPPKKKKLPSSEEKSDDLESKRREIPMAQEDIERLKEKLKKQEVDIEGEIIEKISKEGLIEALLKSLSKEERNVVWLHNAEGYTIKETAEILGKPEYEIRTIHKRALRKLRSKEYIVEEKT